MDAQIMERDMQGFLHAVVDTVEATYATFNIAACGSIFSQDKEPIAYDPTSTEPVCKFCDSYAHVDWCDGLTADEIRKREATNDTDDR